MKIPEHIAIIMDGNGRWAAKRGWPRIIGHREGARNLKRIAAASSDLGVKILTVYGFSVENWARPEREVSMLFRLMKVYTHVGKRMCSKNNIRFSLIGNIAELPKDLREAFLELADFTKNNTGMNLQVAVSYGSRDEITRTLRTLAERIEKKELRADQIDEDLISRSLDTSGQRDPDLVIRTSGEFRISNYLLWQSAYSEFYFSDVLWPEFDETCLMKAIETFNGRERRFGKTGQQLFQESQTS